MTEIETAERPPEAALSRRQIIVIVAGVLVTVILGALDQSVVTPALPAIARELHGLEHLSWIVSAYLLTSTALTLVYGKLSDVHGRRGLMLFAIVTFVAASAVCALAQNIGELIAMRALQGAAAGGLIVTSQATMADLVSPRERARYQVYITTCFALASAAGPPLGGFLVDHLSWRWVFWVNLPIGIAAFLICRRLPANAPLVRGRRIDFFGLVLLTLAVTAFLLVATWGGTTFPWLSLPIAGCVVAGSALLAAFVVRELGAPEPIFPPRLFALSTIRLGGAIVFLLAMLMFGAIVLVPVFLQLVAGVGAGSSGALIVPLLVGMAMASTVCSQYMRRTGSYRLLLPTGIALTATAYVLLSMLTPAATPSSVIVALLVLGLSLGVSMPVINVAAQNAADPRDLGVAISTIIFSRSLGGAFGAAVFWSLLLALFARGLPGDGAAEARNVLFEGGHAGLASLAAGDRAALLVALSHAFHDVFLIGAALAGVAFAIALMMRAEPLKTTRPSERDLTA